MSTSSKPHEACWRRRAHPEHVASPLLLRAVKATIATQASPYGLGLRDDGRFVLTRPAGGSILNRRHGVNSQPALTG
jgi:hypothetical protein